MTPDKECYYRTMSRESPLLIVAGEVQRQDVVVNLIAEEAVPLVVYMAKCIAVVELYSQAGFRV